MSNIEKWQPPTISELTTDIESAFKNDRLNFILNQPPIQKWVKSHPFIKNHEYLPIDKIEYLLRKMFKKFRIEVLKTGMLMNAVEVSVRVHYLHPIDDTWEYHDGVGACELQTQKDTGNLKQDMSNVNRGAVSMALPIAKTYAIKDACDHLGSLFGGNLNRKEIIPFTVDKSIEDAVEHRVTKLAYKCETVESVTELMDTIPSQYIRILDDRISEIEKRDEAKHLISLCNSTKDLELLDLPDEYQELIKERYEYLTGQDIANV